MAITRNVLNLLISLIFVVSILGFVSSLERYDERVYKVGCRESVGWNYERYSNNYERDFDRYHYNNRYDAYNYKKYSEDSFERANKIKYSDYGYGDSRRSFFGDYVKEYSAIVTNRGKLGRYFSVIFTFEDHNGNEFSQTVTKYLRAGEKDKFVYRDIQYDKNEILNWDYTIVPQSR